MPRILFVDDEPANVEVVARTLREALDADVVVADTVVAAVAALYAAPADLVVADVFLPLGEASGGAIGPRARQHAELLDHLGGLMLLDEIDRLDPAPALLVHTACTEPALVELLGERATQRVRKPAPVEVLLDAVLGALRAREG